MQNIPIRTDLGKALKEALRQEMPNIDTSELEKELGNVADTTLSKFREIFGEP